jgi:hypothetical protein
MIAKYPVIDDLEPPRCERCGFGVFDRPRVNLGSHPDGRKAHADLILRL